MNIAERLKDLRKKAGYSQEQVAEMLGISRQAVSKWESAQGYPDIENIIRLAQIYQVSTDHILLSAEAKASPMPVDTERQTKRELHPMTRKTICIIAIIAAIALISVLYIAGLNLVDRYLG